MTSHHALNTLLLMTMNFQEKNESDEFMSISSDIAAIPNSLERKQNSFVGEQDQKLLPIFL